MRFYDNAEVKDILNSSRTEKIGEYSIVRANSSDVTMEGLADWYFNYVAKNNFSWCMIIYTDRPDNSGIYAASFIQNGVTFVQDEYGDYTVSNPFGGVLYVPTERGTLEQLMLQDQEPDVAAQ